MGIIVQTINSLPNLLTLKSAARTEITDAELQLRVNFAEEYKEYLSAFGAILADGIELSGITKAEHRNVVLMTKQEWELNSNVPHSMYVIENTRVDGIIVWQDASGTIYKTSPDLPPKQIAKSLNEYLQEHISQSTT